MKHKVLILGGLGFIGKNLCKRLSADGVQVTILTERIDVDDKNFIADLHKVEIIIGSILDRDLMSRIVAWPDVIFSLAGRSGASDSIKDPYHDLDTNLKGHLNILEACRYNNPDALLIFPSSRLVYGKPERNPVDERHPLQPESIYAIHKLTTEHYYLLYQRLYGLKCIIFRIGNPYGPYQKFGGHHYGVLNWFIHNAIEKKEIQVYGDGKQQRDFIHIDDVVELLCRSIKTESMTGKIYNLGFGQGISLKETAERIADLVKGTKVVFKPWPEIDKKIETGDYISDIESLKMDSGWHPKIGFQEGISKTINFYAK